ncbi:NAD(P)H-dependent oxidoreductase [Paraburkholderia phytofirmans]|uniref:NADPH-dependent FMN reductase n=1 Tax=Paraburkholderia phytofirmans TaxID=261302 RepID=UPI0038B773F2
MMQLYQAAVAFALAAFSANSESLRSVAFRSNSGIRNRNARIMTAKPRIAIVIGPTRPGRCADKAADWMLKQAKARDDIETELLDLLDHPLPFFDEKGPVMSMPRENAEASRWQKTLARHDGFVFVVAEYNHSITGVLKNAFDQAYNEWGRKPFTAIGYGGNGAARAVEHLRLITIALRMVSTEASVHVGGADFMSTSTMGANKPIEDIEASLLAATKSALDELGWWVHATKAAKAA